MDSTYSWKFDKSDYSVSMPAAKTVIPRVVVATTAMLSFISFWRVAAIVLSDLGSSAYYAGGIAERAVGKAAPWFILAIMLFSYAVRSTYIESCSMFVRGGLYPVVKEGDRRYGGQGSCVGAVIRFRAHGTDQRRFRRTLSGGLCERPVRVWALLALLSAEIPKRKVRFIAEESKIGKKTIASALAVSSNPTIRWCNISMSERERDAAGITEALKNRPGHPDHETMQAWIECRIPEDEIREDFFIEQTLRQAKGAASVLMLLGDMHVDAVAEKLEQMGHRVSTDHSLFPVRRWE